MLQDLPEQRQDSHEARGHDEDLESLVSHRLRTMQRVAKQEKRFLK